MFTVLDDQWAGGSTGGVVNADVAAPWRATMLSSQWVGIVKLAAA